MFVALLDHELLEAGDVVILEAPFLKFTFIGLSFIYHDDVITVTILYFVLTHDSAFEEGSTIIANAGFLQELFVHLELHVNWVNSNHQREKSSDMQLADFSHGDNIKEFKMLVHAYNDVPRLKLLHAVEFVLWTEFKVVCMVFWILSTVPADHRNEVPVVTKLFTHLCFTCSLRIS